MQPITQDAVAGVRRSLLLIVALMAVSTVVFVVGVAIERRGEAAEGAGAHQELSGEPEAGEAAESSEGEGVHEEVPTKKLVRTRRPVELASIERSPSSASTRTPPG